MLQRSAPRSSHRLIGVISAFSLVAGVGVVLVVGQSLADGPKPVSRLSLGPNLIDNSGFGSGLRSWSGSKGNAGAIDITEPGVWGSTHAVRLQTRKASVGSLRDQRTSAPRAHKGTVYQASAWMRATGKPVSGALKLYEWQQGVVINVTGQDFTVGSGGWERVTLLTTAEADLSGLQISMTARRLNTQRGVRIDRVLLHPVKGAGPDETVTPLPDDSQPDGDSTVSPTPTPSMTTTSATPSSSPSPTPTPTDTSSTSPSGTLYGASVYEAGRTWTQAVADSNSAYGGMDVVRVFYPGLPSAWPGRAGQVNGPVVVSFKAQPSDVLSGKYDAFFADWFKKAPQTSDIWWAYWHEPEDDVEAGAFSSQQWRDAYRRIAGFADAARNPMLHNTVILMCWTMNPKSGRTFDNYFPGADVVETLGWDCYSHPSDPTAYAKADDMYGRAVTKSKELGIPFGIAETGSRLAQGDESGTKRAAWLRYIARWAADRDASFMTYFDSVVGGEFRLLDEPSRTAWRDVVTTF